MQDWRKITWQVEHALTLDEASLLRLLEGLDEGPEARASRRLIERLRPAQGFMATSVAAPPAARQRLRSGERLGVWKVLEPVGEGGGGAVYRAVRDDGLYEQEVAIKVLGALDARAHSRFEAERRRLARMQHPGIARIVDGGVQEDGQPWLAMEFVEGTTIDRYVEQRHLTPAARITLLLDLCAAVAHAHRNLTVHSDIKAANVLVDGAGAVRLIDFGIATSLSGEGDEGRAFTLATAAPEQLRGEVVTVGVDVFALGVLLHQLLTGRLPEREADASMRADDAALASAELSAIIARCLAPEPQERYPSVDALAAELRAVLEHRPVQARGDSRAYRLTCFLRRNALSSGLAGVAVLALLGGLAFSVSFARQAQHERDLAQENLARAEFFLDRANLFYAAQNAYSDALQRSFGGEADVARQTEVLKARWQQAHDLRAQDPELAAQLGHAIGRHFLFRNDYPTAIAILEPWVSEGYGPPDLLMYGAHLLAIAYVQTGQTEKAVPQLRRIAQWYASSYDRGSADHIAAATQLAGATREEADIRAAEVLLAEGLRQDQEPSIAMYLYNQLARMHRLRGNLEGAHVALREVVAVIEAHPLMDLSGTDTGRLNLAEFDYWRRADVANAERLAQRVAEGAREAKGESQETARALTLLALIRAERGETDAALAATTEALVVLSRLGIEGSETSAAVRIARAEIQLQAGELEQAGRTLAGARAAVAELPASSEQRVRLRYAEALWYHASGRARRAAALLDDAAIDPSVIEGSPMLLHIRGRLPVFADGDSR